jgi:uncharacterized DUF497 family protein
MSVLRFEWDGRKAAANLRKHGVSFEEANSVFYDERARLIADPDHFGAQGDRQGGAILFMKVPHAQGI